MIGENKDELSDEDVLLMYSEMCEEFGDRLPDFETHPALFAYYVKLFKYIKGLENDKQTVSVQA
jgi:hypothetical protein